MSRLGHIADQLTGGRLTKREFETRYARYLESGEWKAGDGESLTEAFLKSAGSWLTEASAMTTAAKSTYDFDQAHDVLGLWNTPGSFDRALKDLTTDGYAILDTRLPQNSVDELVAAFAQAPCTLTSDKGTSLSADETVRVSLDAPLAEKYAVTTNTLVQSDLVRSLLLDQGLLRIAQAYLGSVPIIDIITAWYSFPSETPSHEAAQLFHFDLDRIRWLKVFFLLTDQDLDTGAHIYVPGTQRDGGIDSGLLSRGYARLEDDEVDKFHPRSTWKTMEGKAGVILLEDTRGLHKGTNLTRDHRLMLQFEYAQSLFGHKAHLAETELQPVTDPHWKQMEASYPETFAALRR
jgi:hypothetical protein